MPALQRGVAWAEERLLGALRQSVHKNGRVHLHIIDLCRTPQVVGNFEALRFIEAEEKGKTRQKKAKEKRKTRKEKNKFTATFQWL